MIAHQLEHWVEFQRGWWAVIQNGKLIGWNGLYYLAETDETEVGYMLSRAYWGQGFGTESTRAALEYGFNVLGLEQVIGLTHPDNIASQKVLLNSGLRFIQRQNYFGMEMCKFRISRS
jgi:RimJ/RimL family protein N-acetyltransferase